MYGNLSIVENTGAFHGVSWRTSLIGEVYNMDGQLKRAYGYIRVSTKQQAGEDRMGMEAQRQAITEYADRNGFTVVKWYVDEISGVKEDRPNLNEILFTDIANRDNVDAVIAYKSDRIARDIKLYFYYLFVLERKRIKLISVSEQFDDDSGLSTVFRALMLFVAEQERKNIATRTTMGRKVKAGQGGYSGGRVPYGYAVADHRLVVDPDEAQIIRSVYALRAYGYTMRNIAETLNDRGFRTRKGGLFGSSGVQSILDNQRTYEGFYRYGKGGTWVKGQHEPILTGDFLDGIGMRPCGNMVIEQQSDIIDAESDADESFAPEQFETPEPSYPDLDNEVAEAEETIEAEPVTAQPVTPEPPRPVTFVGGVFHA
jgi:DNA invertase Pin-like site-specific DNA recombinase